MNIKHVLIVFKKELIDMFRDKKTIISSILIPILIFPIMYGFMGFSQKRITKDVEEKGIAVAIESENKDASIVKFLESKEDLKITDVTDPDEAVKKGTVQAIIFIDKDFDEILKTNKPVPITIQYDDTNQTSMMAAQTIRQYISEFSSSVVTQRLTAKGIDTSILIPIDIQEKRTAPKGDDGIGMMIFAMIMPLMLAIYSATSVLPAATDNGAGEKERGTLEPLLTTQANRLSLLMGKYLAITVAGVIGTLASMIGLFIAQKSNPELLGKGMAIPITSILIIALASICLSLIFAAIELAISVYARSFKEAQTYLSPVTILVMIPAFAVYMMDPKNIADVYFHIPLVNIICIIKELIVGIYNPLHIAISFMWAIVYIAISIFFAKFMFDRESVIFRV